jgi:serine/threonine protein phosphatase PrpC
MSSQITLSSGHADDQGRRDTMEDTHVSFDRISDHNSLVIHDTLKGKFVTFFGVYDGHGGRETAEKLENDLHKKIFEKLNTNCVEDSIKTCFQEIDKEIIDAGWMNGSTAVICFTIDNILYSANLGDSEAILISDDNGIKVESLTYNHKASDPDERDRILKLGGHVFFGRVFGALAVSRSFGDPRYKKPKTSEDFVSWEPYLCKPRELNSKNKALVLACDGLWDVMSHDEVGTLVMQEKNSGVAPKDIAAKLVKLAIEEKYSEDNVTVIVVFIDAGDNNNNTVNNNNNTTTTNNSTTNTNSN